MSGVQLVGHQTKARWRRGLPAGRTGGCDDTTNGQPALTALILVAAGTREDAGGIAASQTRAGDRSLPASRGAVPQIRLRRSEPAITAIQSDQYQPSSRL